MNDPRNAMLTDAMAGYVFPVPMLAEAILEQGHFAEYLHRLANTLSRAADNAEKAPNAE